MHQQKAPGVTEKTESALARLDRSGVVASDTESGDTLKSCAVLFEWVYSLLHDIDRKHLLPTALFVIF